eukprot:364539-Chlamydomonas_euryale.AAC.10
MGLGTSIRVQACMQLQCHMGHSRHQQPHRQSLTPAFPPSSTSHVSMHNSIALPTRLCIIRARPSALHNSLVRAVAFPTRYTLQCRCLAKTNSAWWLCADQDSVRLLAVESCSAFAVALSREDTVRQLLPVVLKFSQVGSCSSWGGGDVGGEGRGGVGGEGRGAGERR